MTVGTRMVSCTQEISAVAIEEVPSKFKESEAINALLRGRRIVLVDTPGFDDTLTPDSTVLIRIAKWLESSFV